MLKSEQTKEVKIHLYNLTRNFVYKYIHQYYKQYQGDLDDLVSDFYIQFLTPKARIKGKEQSLLDKYDDSITSLEYLVKVSVIRKLIDRSRSDKGKVSIDKRWDDCGDMTAIIFGLYDDQDADETVDSKEFTKSAYKEVERHWNALDAYHKQVLQNKYAECRSALAINYRNLFDAVIGKKEESKPVEVLTLFVLDEDHLEECKVQQVTDKTIVAYFDDKCYDFDRFTGLARKKELKDRGICIEEESLEYIGEHYAKSVYKSGYSRKQFDEGTIDLDK